MTTHLTNTFTSARLLAAVMTSILLLGVLAPTGFSGTSDGFLNFSNTPLIGPQPTITTFDAPGAGTGPGQGTLPFAINPAGTVLGYYIDAGDASHGFLRALDGTITTFDAPNAGTGPGQGTIVFAVDCLNPAGAITATSLDANNVNHGFVRASDGTITTFEVPGAGTGPGQGVVPENISAPGVVTGNYLDASDVNHGFVRARHGAITTFDVSGAGTGPGQGTIPFCNNPVNGITGVYIDASDVNHGFLRSPQHSAAQ